MRHLLLLRHAQALAAHKDQSDEDRPLSERGHAEALEAAQCIAACGLRIDALLVSPALRTRETALIVAAKLDLSSQLRFEPKLYLGAPEALLAPLRRCARAAHTVLMVAHNPGLSELARRCSPEQEPVELRTAGICRVDFDRDAWHGVQPDMASACTVLR